MTTGAVFHYLIPFSAHLIAFPSTLFDFMSITKVICFYSFCDIVNITLFYHFLPRYKKDADIHSTADIPGIFRKNIRQARLFILTSFSHSHIVIKNVS